MLFFSVLLSASLFSHCSASSSDPHAPTRLLSRATSHPNAQVNGSEETGWEFLPDIPDATTILDWPIDKNSGASMPVYQTTGLVNSQIKRAVISLPGKARDCWQYWNTMNNALYIANEQDPTIQREEVLIMAPCFLTEVDRDAGAAGLDQLLWGTTTWISGYQNAGSDVLSFSSYDILDTIVDHFMDKETYPNLNALVLAGHSAGAQMSQRYMGLRKSTKNDERLHHWIANPGSLLWLTEDRPVTNSSCESVNEFKYGLDGGFPAYAVKNTRKLGTEGIVKRYRQRNAHYAWGLEDNGPGDQRCQAQVQGASHLARGRNFETMLKGMEGGIPSHTTIDFIPGVSHDNVQMMNSPQGIEKLFRFDYEGSLAVTYETTGEPEYDAAESASLSLSPSCLLGLFPLLASALWHY